MSESLFTSLVTGDGTKLYSLASLVVISVLVLLDQLGSSDLR